MFLMQCFLVNMINLRPYTVQAKVATTRTWLYSKALIKTLYPMFADEMN